jgi:hypothetical protein
MGSSLGQIKPKTIKLVFVASPPSRQHKGEKTNDSLARNQDIEFERGDMSGCGCCFSEIAL